MEGYVPSPPRAVRDPPYACMRELDALHALAVAMGVHTRYTDGLLRDVEPSPDTLIQVCTALGAPLDRPADAEDALRRIEARRAERRLRPVAVAWDGVLAESLFVQPRPLGGDEVVELILEDGTSRLATVGHDGVRISGALPSGVHELRLQGREGKERCIVLSAPTRAFRRPGERRSWGVGTHLAALRSRRSRSVGDLGDLERACEWISGLGGDLVTALPLLPTFNEVEDPEPSPYSPVSRLFWSELILDLGEHHRPAAAGPLDVTRADAEVRAALAGVQAPVGAIDAELAAYARFRGAQKRLGRDWRRWPAAARRGGLRSEDVDQEEEWFHQAAQLRVREQLAGLRVRLDDWGVRLGLDLAVGAHPDGYDTWSRQDLFAPGMSVGAPPDPGFPSGQDWGFSPVLPDASRSEGHRYISASIAHQASLAGMLRVDHVMAFNRLYWIPHGMSLDEGTYVDYPMEELFAVLTLESERCRCEVVGENLGTVPAAVDDALERHGIAGMYLALFEARGAEARPPGEGEVALIGTHDTPTLAGWVAGADIGERVRCGLLDPSAEKAERENREGAAASLAELLGGSLDDLGDLLDRLLGWLGRSESPLVIPWLEDLWLESEQVNLPGTRSSERPNWQRPMARVLDEAIADPVVAQRLERLADARARASSSLGSGAGP